MWSCCEVDIDSQHVAACCFRSNGYKEDGLRRLGLIARCDDLQDASWVWTSPVSAVSLSFFIEAGGSSDTRLYVFSFGIQLIVLSDRCETFSENLREWRTAKMALKFRLNNLFHMRNVDG